MKILEYRLLLVDQLRLLEQKLWTYLKYIKSIFISFKASWVITTGQSLVNFYRSMMFVYWFHSFVRNLNPFRTTGVTWVQFACWKRASKMLNQNFFLSINILVFYKQNNETLRTLESWNDRWTLVMLRKLEPRSIWLSAYPRGIFVMTYKLWFITVWVCLSSNLHELTRLLF